MSNDSVGMYAVLDVKSGLYDIPFFSRNDQLARRRFILDCRAGVEKNMLASFKDEFELRRVGTFHQLSGEFNSENEIIIKGKEVEL